MMLRMKLVAGAAAVSLLFFGAVLTTGSLISEVSYFTRGKEQVQQRKAISGSTAKRLIRRGFFHRRLCYLYGMCSSFFLRLRAGAFLFLMAMSQAASTQPLADPAMWTEIHDRLGAPVLLAFAVAAFSLLVVYRSARSEVRRRQQIELETELERERLNAILNRAGVGVLLFEADGRLFDVNHRACQMFGYRRRDARARLTVRDLVHPEDCAAVTSHLRELFSADGAAQVQECCLRRRDGSVFWGIVSTSLVTDREGRGKWCVAMVTDIDPQKRAEEALRESEERLRFITENTHDIVWQLSSDFRFTYVNGADERLRGFARDEVLGHRFTEWLTPVGQSVFEHALAISAPDAQAGATFGAMRFEVEMRCKDGGTFWAEINATPIHGPDGGIAGYIGVTRDTTQHRKAREMLREQSIRDPLTNLFNRRFLDESLDRELARARRDGVPLAVLMVDIDHFKQLNDTYGHPAGDEVIRRLGNLLRTGARGGDLPCRYGGEEFLLVLPNMTAETAVERAEQWRQAFSRERVRVGEHDVRSTASIGVAVFPWHGECRETLIRAADEALYAAKRGGRNRVVVAVDPGVPAGAVVP